MQHHVAPCQAATATLLSHAACDAPPGNPMWNSGLCWCSGVAGAEAAAAAASGAVKDVPPDSDAEPSGASDSEASMSDDDELREVR